MPIAIDLTSDLEGFNDQPRISLSEYMRATENFNRYYCADSQVNRGTCSILPWSELNGYVQSYCANESIPLDQAVLVIFHGFDATQGQIVRGLKVIQQSLQPKGGYYDVFPNLEDEPYPTHFIYTDQATQINFRSGTVNVNRINTIQPMAWKSFRDAYFEKFMVHRAPEYPTSLNWQSIRDSANPIPNPNPGCVLFPWENELVKMHDDNPSSGVPFILISDFAPFIINGTSRVELIGPDGYYHSLALHMADSNGQSLTELLKNKATVATPNFTDLGVDYGNLCPPRCKEIRLS